jgi:hypothetical protein
MKFFNKKTLLILLSFAVLSVNLFGMDEPDETGMPIFVTDDSDDDYGQYVPSGQPPLPSDMTYVDEQEEAVLAPILQVTELSSLITPRTHRTPRRVGGQTLVTSSCDSSSLKLVQAGNGNLRSSWNLPTEEERERITVDTSTLNPPVCLATQIAAARRPAFGAHEEDINIDLLIRNLLLHGEFDDPIVQLAGFLFRVDRHGHIGINSIDDAANTGLKFFWTHRMKNVPIIFNSPVGDEFEHDETCCETLHDFRIDLQRGPDADLATCLLYHYLIAEYGQEGLDEEETGELLLMQEYLNTQLPAVFGHGSSSSLSSMGHIGQTFKYYYFAYLNFDNPDNILEFIDRVTRDRKPYREIYYPLIIQFLDRWQEKRNNLDFLVKVTRRVLGNLLLTSQVGLAKVMHNRLYSSVDMELVNYLVDLKNELVDVQEVIGFDQAVFVKEDHFLECSWNGGGGHLVSPRHSSILVRPTIDEESFILDQFADKGFTPFCVNANTGIQVGFWELERYFARSCSLRHKMSSVFPQHWSQQDLWICLESLCNSDYRELMTSSGNRRRCLGTYRCANAHGNEVDIHIMFTLNTASNTLLTAFPVACFLDYNNQLNGHDFTLTIDMPIYNEDGTLDGMRAIEYVKNHETPKRNDFLQTIARVINGSEEFGQPVNLGEGRTGNVLFYGNSNRYANRKCYIIQFPEQFIVIELHIPNESLDLETGKIL